MLVLTMPSTTNQARGGSRTTATSKMERFVIISSSCKVLISTPIKRHDNKKALSVVDDVIEQLQQLNTETIINVSTEKNMLGKKGLQLNRNGFKQFTKNSIDAFREL